MKRDGSVLPRQLFLIQPAELEEVTLKVSQVSNANALSQVLEPPPGRSLEHVERPTKQFCRKLRLCICIGGCKQRSNCLSNNCSTEVQAEQQEFENCKFFFLHKLFSNQPPPTTYFSTFLQLEWAQSFQRPGSNKATHRRRAIAGL